MANKSPISISGTGQMQLIDSINMHNDNKNTPQLNIGISSPGQLSEKISKYSDQNTIGFINTVNDNKKDLSACKVNASPSPLARFIQFVKELFEKIFSSSKAELQPLEADEVFYDPEEAPIQPSDRQLTNEEAQHFREDFAKFMRERQIVTEGDNDDEFYDFPEQDISENKLEANSVDFVEVALDSKDKTSMPELSIKDIYSKKHYIEYELAGQKYTPEETVSHLYNEWGSKFKSFIEDNNLKHVENEISFSQKDNRLGISITANAAHEICKKMGYSSTYAYKAEIILDVFDNKIAIDVKAYSFLAKAAISGHVGAEWISSLLQPQIYEALINNVSKNG